MTKRSLVALGVLLLVTPEFLAAAPKHPLDHLTAAEHWTAYEILRDSGQAESDMVILYVGLHEPPKSEVLAWRHGEDFRREAIVQLLQNNQGYEAILDLEAGTILDWRDTPGFGGAEAEWLGLPLRDVLRRDSGALHQLRAAVHPQRTPGDSQSRAGSRERRPGVLVGSRDGPVVRNHGRVVGPRRPSFRLRVRIWAS